MSSGSFHGFSPVPSPEITQDRDRESVLAEILQLLREQRVLPTVVSDAANWPSAPGDPVSTWAANESARTIVPPVGFPAKESTRLHGGPCQWIYSDGPAPGGIPETALRGEAGDCPPGEAGDPADPPEPERNPQVDPVRLRSPNLRKIPGPDGNPRLPAVRLGSPGDREKLRSTSGRSRTGEPFEFGRIGYVRLRAESPNPIGSPEAAGIPLSGRSAGSMPFHSAPSARQLAGEPTGTSAPEQHYRVRPAVIPPNTVRNYLLGTNSGNNGQALVSSSRNPTSDNRRLPSPAAAGSSRQLPNDRRLLLPFTYSSRDVPSWDSEPAYDYSAPEHEPDPSPTDDRISDADDLPETWSHAEPITLARSFLTDELPVTDGAARATVPRLSTLAQVDYVVPVTTQPGFPLSSAMVNNFHQINCDLQPPPVGKSQRFASVPRSRDTLYAPEARSSGHFPFSRESPAVDGGFADISRSTPGGGVAQHRLSPEQRYLRDLAVMSRRRICIIEEKA